MPCSKPSQSISNLSLIKNQIPWIILLSYFDSIKNIHNMLLCYRLQTCCNIKIYIYCNFGSSYYIFLFEDYLFNSTPLSWGKKRCIFFIFIFWLQRFIYVYVSFFSTMQKDREESHFKFYSELCYLELSLPGIRIIAFVVGLDSDDEILR